MAEKDSFTFNENDDPKFESRMHEQTYPKEDDLCMVTVTSTTEMGTYVSLKEYNNIQGMIPMSEHTRKKYNKTRMTKVGKDEVATVIKVDPESGFIDLSLKKTTPEDKKRYIDKFAKLKEAHLIMRTTAVKTNSNLQQLYEQFGWPLANEYGTLYDALRKFLTDETIFDKYNLNENVAAMLKETIRMKLSIQPLKFRADLDVSCFAMDGVESIKKALLRGLEVANDPDFEIKLVSSPTYGLYYTKNVEKSKGFDVMNAVINAIREEIEKLSGSCVVKREPFTMTKDDDDDASVTDENTSQDFDE